MVRVTSMPMSRAASVFCTTASRDLPRRVRRSNSASAAAITMPTTGMTSCKRVDARAEHLDRPHREHGREAARLLAEREQNRVVEHDAAGHRRHQPGVGPARSKRANQGPLHHQPESGAAENGRGTGERQRQAQANGKDVSQHGAQHHRAALGEVDRVRHHVGHVEAERDQAVHGAQASPLRHGRGDENDPPPFGSRSSGRKGKGAAGAAPSRYPGRGYCVSGRISPSTKCVKM